ncbi:lycopene cyclase domain-containing protein [Longimicrobium sp.]|uniref:lycopene cyclase domain-containing protein n=1 Tax=Longimicrobium sp. TaxID=2029185 RepID=UPI002E364EB7|nr:lycopene cyclase domain-containing protein [Longimicrobium sp.]HEX6041024.1 lycopene cyclase domain-containing protein [Longimicrobium sp.]
MTYLQFHLVFILPPLFLVALASRGSLRRLGARALPSLVGVVLIALVYTTPWDTELIRRGVWGYGPERVMGTIGLIPIEEYMFFVLQPLLAGLWFYRLVPPDLSDAAPPSATMRWSGTAVYALLALLGVWLLQRREGTYMGMILAWAAPVLAAQWALIAGRIAAAPRAFILGIAVPTAYLWVADAIAIHLGIWHISKTQTLGVRFGSLPLEEATFFLATTLLCVQGLTLFLFPAKKAVTAAARAGLAS